MRGGQRLRGVVYGFFGVGNKGARMQVPELFGSHVSTLRISEVLSTAETLDSTDTVTNPVGNLHGHGIAIGGTPTFNYTTPEHGWIICMLNVQPYASYDNQGLQRKFAREDIFDYFWPQFAHIGEQAVLNRELYVDDTDANRQGVFGYIPRYSEYRYINNRLSGDMGNDLNFWNFSRSFSSTPTLNANFVLAQVRDDPFAVPDDDNLIAQVYHKIRCVRPVPRYGNPRV